MSPPPKYEKMLSKDRRIFEYVRERLGFASNIKAILKEYQHVVICYLQFQKRTSQQIAEETLQNILPTTARRTEFN